jgi:hypothetical protein
MTIGSPSVPHPSRDCPHLGPAKDVPGDGPPERDAPLICPRTTHSCPIAEPTCPGAVPTCPGGGPTLPGAGPTCPGATENYRDAGPTDPDTAVIDPKSAPGVHPERGVVAFHCSG